MEQADKTIAELEAQISTLQRELSESQVAIEQRRVAQDEVRASIQEIRGHIASLTALIEILGAGGHWLSHYVEWELGLLTHLGYGLDLSECAATGAIDDLVFVSPRTGCAVSAGAGAPYREKLFALPAFFMARDTEPSAEDIRTGLRITGHFLARCAKDADAGELPRSRARFVDRVARDARE
ncbi:MAG: hypothetical protein EBU57_10735 [Alphaproteobacteria bacterium]|nr:hypothetical protein [Alphaproteobacteria bacterium]